MPWESLSPRVVMVAAFGPRDGIGRYARQLAAAHGDGRTFFLVGIPEAPGDDHTRELHRGPRALWLLRDAGRDDDVVVHWHPHYYIRRHVPARIASYASWGLLGLRRRLTVVEHEPDPPSGGRVEEAVRRWAWRRAHRVVVHSGWERDRHEQRYGVASGQELVVVGHGEFFATSLDDTHAEARERMGLAPDRVVLLMIGFLSSDTPDKGYDRAIAALGAAGAPALELHIVCSPIRKGPDTDRLVVSLRAAEAESPQVQLHEGFVDDETFDRWIRAADAVLTPYRTSSSSGVAARAHLLGTPVITSDVGGLAEQAGPGDVVVHDDVELAEAIRSLAAARRPA